MISKVLVWVCDVGGIAALATFGFLAWYPVGWAIVGIGLILLARQFDRE